MRTTSTSIQPKLRFMRLPQVLERFPVSRATWWAGVKEGRYPKAVKLGPNCTAWIESEIDALIERQINASRATK